MLAEAVWSSPTWEGPFWEHGGVDLSLGTVSPGLCITPMPGLCISQGSPKQQTNEMFYLSMHLSREIYYKELTHLIVEAEKSQDL